MPFITDGFAIPESLTHPSFVIRKLTYFDAELDYQAVMSSIDIIHATRGGTWPSPDLSFVDDQIDLAWHQREFEFRSSFAYTVMSLDETECLGCIYLYPPGYRDSSSQNADVDASFWVTQKAYDQGFYPVLYTVLDEWLKTTWPFRRIGYTNKVIP